MISVVQTITNFDNGDAMSAVIPTCMSNTFAYLYNSVNTDGDKFSFHNSLFVPMFSFSLFFKLLIVHIYHSKEKYYYIIDDIINTNYIMIGRLAKLRAYLFSLLIDDCVKIDGMIDMTVKMITQEVQIAYGMLACHIYLQSY